MTVALRIATSTADDAVVIVPLGYDERTKALVYRLLPAAAWNKTMRAWVMPITAGSVWRLRDALDVLRLMADARVECTDRVRFLVKDLAVAHRPPPCDDDLPFADRSLTQPWRHQRMAWWFLRYASSALQAALLDCGMRTGKTRMVLDHFCGLPPEQRRGLVLCPKSVVPVWEEQARRHHEPGTLRVVALERGSVEDRVRRAVRLLTDERAALVVVGWSVLERLNTSQKQGLRAALDGATVVADEVHYAKAPGSSRSQNLAFIAERAAMRIGASGTPLAHSPLDAYGVFRFLDRGLWGSSFARFREQYAVMGGFGGKQVVAHKNLEDLAARMRPYTFRATREVLDLPPAQDVTIKVTLPPAVQKLYVELQEEAVVELKSGTLIADNGLSRLLRLAQLTSGYLPAQDGSGGHDELHSEKRDALVDLLQSSAPDEPWVVFGRFRYDLAEAHIAAGRAGRPCFELSGAKHELAQWKETCRAGHGAVLAAQIQAGGIGVDMTEAALCCYMSVGYSLAEYEQSRPRIHGPDQQRPVAYYHLVARGTVDVAIRAALRKRADVLSYVAAELMAPDMRLRRAQEEAEVA